MGDKDERRGSQSTKQESIHSLGAAGGVEMTNPMPGVHGAIDNQLVGAEFAVSSQAGGGWKCLAAKRISPVEKLYTMNKGGQLMVSSSNH